MHHIVLKSEVASLIRNSFSVYFRKPESIISINKCMYVYPLDHWGAAVGEKMRTVWDQLLDRLARQLREKKRQEKRAHERVDY